jgi:RsiW-degrading membrane proteinase PrsW (M82 family)
MNLETIGYALLSGILPALLWLWFWVKEDNLHPEPKKIIFLTFIAGAITVVVALVLEKFIADIFPGDLNSTTRYIFWSAAEEITKLLAVTAIALSSKEMDEPIDAMIYCITVALGFAAIENSLFIFTHLNIGDVTKGIIAGNMRFMGATLVHVVSSASIGFMIGLTLYKNIFLKSISITFGVILAITLHAAFNLSIIEVRVATDTLKIFGWVWGAIVILLILFEEIKVVKPRAPEANKNLLEIK